MMKNVNNSYLFFDFNCKRLLVKVMFVLLNMIINKMYSGVVMVKGNVKLSFCICSLYVNILKWVVKNVVIVWVKNGLMIN